MIYVHVSRTHGVSICVCLQIIVSICPSEKRRVCPRSGVVAALPLAPLPTSLMIGIYLTCLATAIEKRLGFGLASGIQCMLIREPTIHQSSSRMKPGICIGAPMHIFISSKLNSRQSDARSGKTRPISSEVCAVRLSSRLDKG